MRQSTKVICRLFVLVSITVRMIVHCMRVVMVVVLVFFFCDVAELLLCDAENVDDLKDTDGVDEEEHDEPDLFSAAGSEPERPAFPGERPESGDDNDAAEAGAKERRVHKERVVVHKMDEISVLLVTEPIIPPFAKEGEAEKLSF